MLRRCASLDVSSCVRILCVLVACNCMVLMWAILVYNLLQRVYPLSWVYRIHLRLATESFGNLPWSIERWNIMFCWTLLCVLGILLTFSLVKTDENCLIRICAFPLLLFIKCPRSFSGATPMFSCFLDLTYFQKGFVLFFSIPSSIAEFI